MAISYSVERSFFEKSCDELINNIKENLKIVDTYNFTSSTSFNFPKSIMVCPLGLTFNMGLNF